MTPYLIHQVSIFKTQSLPKIRAFFLCRLGEPNNTIPSLQFLHFCFILMGREVVKNLWVQKPAKTNLLSEEEREGVNT